MSRRAPNPAAERAAQNQATIKNLLKLEANKICSDCKKNKHPRWASWNLGVFICIRCSGIHRGMGTHISRVKSVDLDSWTDEQLQSVLRWGNARANKYWEAKLAAGHAPSEAKIENFIRTKYELKRWVMDGPMPDPATLDADADDDVPLSLVREKQVIEKKETARKASVGQNARPSAVGDLIGGTDAATPPRAAATKAVPAPPKTTTATTTKDSLLGLDFLGESSGPPRPSSTPAAQAQSRPDLKQSILSLYATAPKPQPPAQQQQQNSGGWGSPPVGHQQQASQGGSFSDAFGGLSLSNPTSPKPPAADPFAGLGSGMGSGRATQHVSRNSSSAFGGLSGGSFFDNKPAAQSVTNHSSSLQSNSSSNQFASSGGFGDFASPVASAPSKPALTTTTTTSSAMGDLFDLSAPVSQSSPPPAPAFSPPAQQPASTNSVFNLSAPQSKPAATPVPSNNSLGGGFSAAGLSGVDAWGGNEWATPAATSPPAAAAQPAASSSKPAASSDMGWGGASSAFANTPIVPGASGGFNPAPKVTADEEFGGWASSTGMGGSQTATTTTAPKTGSGGGFGGDDDLFSNVWQ